MCVLALATPKQHIDERRHFNIRVILKYAVCPAMLPGVGCTVVLIALTCNSKICSLSCYAARCRVFCRANSLNV